MSVHDYIEFGAVTDPDQRIDSADVPNSCSERPCLEQIRLTCIIKAALIRGELCCTDDRTDSRASIVLVLINNKRLTYNIPSPNTSDSAILVLTDICSSYIIVAGNNASTRSLSAVHPENNETAFSCILLRRFIPPIKKLMSDNTFGLQQVWGTLRSQAE